MTEANQRRLYAHYLKKAEGGRNVIFGKGKLTEKQMAQNNVAMMEKAYPHFKEKPKEDTPGEKPKSKRKK